MSKHSTVELVRLVLPGGLINVILVGLVVKDAHNLVNPFIFVSLDILVKGTTSSAMVLSIWDRVGEAGV